MADGESPQPVLQHVSLDISFYKTDGEKPTFTIEITHDHPEGDLKLLNNGRGGGGGVYGCPSYKGVR